ncbi:MAG TPA: PQQ-binding-like beta-propeller repeat protein [Pirellulaceae bacterium]|nr:PQQ-binding-like beta-propeller repeat protein [Pirellulaceae bacterium]
MFNVLPPRLIAVNSFCAGTIAAAWLLAALSAPAFSADWPQFRGPTRDGSAADAKIPTTWDNSTNLVWKTELPGPGASGPVIWKDKVVVTCYSGYGLSENDPGEMSQLTRHVLCFDLPSGKKLWRYDLPAKQPEQEFRGFGALHGFASSTPATDGQNVYVFFGKSGVVALTLDGQHLWTKSVGDRTHNWGSATSPVLYKDLVIVNASVESGSLVALDKKTGNEVWSTPRMRRAWSSPVLATDGGAKTPELVVSMQGEVQGLDPASGKQLWTCPGVQDYVCPSPMAFDGIVVAIGGRAGTGIAIKLGGTGEVMPFWEVNRGSNVSSPVYHDDHLFWANESRGIVYCADATTGELKYDQRLEPRSDRIYASPVLAGGNVYYVSRQSGVYVVAAKPEYKLVSHVPPLDKSVFNASPAVVGDRMLLRSNEALYCIGK